MLWMELLILILVATMSTPINSVQEYRDAMSDKYVVFYAKASWAGPCVAVKPVWQRQSEAYKDSVKFREMDIDDSPDLKKELGVKTVPTFIFFKDGKKVNDISGPVNDAKLSGAIDDLKK